ncbi:MAG TPA: TetR/AcrR family transcriptional regulator [Chloroflexia bacterium]|nr:TetR/AcrR family transcriptional regulator [Chloroflexia bacterium]
MEHIVRENSERRGVMPGPEGRNRRRADRRSRRTRQVLGEALVALMLEKRYDTITVQEIIDRANVGRSTFYAHFLDKEDLLQIQVAELVVNLGRHMERGGAGNRIVPSLELLRHLRESYALIRALVRGRAMETVLKTMQTHLSLHVEARLARSLPSGSAPAVPLPVVAQYVAGALMTLFQWWLDREMPESPEQIEEYFLQLVRPSVREATGVEI